MGYDGADGEEMMCIDIEMWQWLYLPLFLAGLCLCLHFGCFTKKNIAAWIASLVFCSAAATLAIDPFPYLHDSEGFSLAYTAIATAFMLVYFYGVRKRTAVSEALSFTLFAVTSYGIVGTVIAFFLWSFGILH